MNTSKWTIFSFIGDRVSNLHLFFFFISFLLESKKKFRVNNMFYSFSYSSLDNEILFKHHLLHIYSCASFSLFIYKKNQYSGTASYAASVKFQIETTWSCFSCVDYDKAYVLIRQLH